MSSAERFFALKISLVMAVRMLGLFMLFPVMSVYAGDYESCNPFSYWNGNRHLWPNSSYISNPFWLPLRSVW